MQPVAQADEPAKGFALRLEQPDEILPGIPIFFATSYPGYSGVSQGLLIKQTEGRPIKVEGNPDHPGSLGGTDLISQGTILGLYDPDRSRGCVKLGTPYGFDKFLDETRQLLDAQKPTQGAGIRFLTEPTTSPTLAAQIEDFLKRFPKAKWIQYEPVGRDNARRANLAAFGKPVNPVYKLDKAQVVLSLDCDFLSAAGVGYVRYARDFMANRRVREVPESIQRGEGIPLDKMNRLYAVESMVTSTRGGRGPPPAARAEQGRRPDPRARGQARRRRRDRAGGRRGSPGVGRRARGRLDRPPGHYTRTRRGYAAGGGPPDRARDQREARRVRQNGGVHRARWSRARPPTGWPNSSRSPTIWRATRSNCCS